MKKSKGIYRIGRQRDWAERRAPLGSLRSRGEKWSASILEKYRLFCAESVAKEKGGDGQGILHVRFMRQTKGGYLGRPFNEGEML